MNRAISISLAGLATGLFCATVQAGKPTDDDGDYNGNGSPSGAHYTLNIIGMQSGKGKVEEDTDQSNGRRIFVIYNGNTKILLTEGDFDVIDYDGTDGTAIFQLPNPDPDCDGTTDYSVYGRALGGGGWATLATCASEDGPGGATIDYCSTGTDVAVFDRTQGGRSVFTNVSRQLLYVSGDFGDGLKRYPLFGDDGYTYWWDYTNNQLPPVGRVASQAVARASNTMTIRLRTVQGLRP